MTIGERIKILRKNLGLTQQAFADALGIKQNTVATYEMGRTNISSMALAGIVRVFNVNETWLRTGEGEMFLPKDEADELAELFASIMNTEPSSKIRRLAVAFSKLTPEQREALADLAESFAEKYK